MAQNLFSRRTLVALVGIAAVFTACKKTDLDTAIPANTPPVMYIQAPNVANQQAQVGEVLVWQLQLKDNEDLRALRIVTQLQDAVGKVLYRDSIEQSISITGKESLMQHVFTIPSTYDISPNPTTYNVGINYRWVFKYYVLDREGLVDSAQSSATVIGAPSPTDSYKIEEYTNDVMDRGAFVTSNRRAFNLPGHFYASNTLDMDIREFQTSGASETVYRPRLISPNNNNGNNIFAVVSQATFNYNLATYSTIQRAFLSARVLNDTTPPLNVGDVLIVRLRNNNTNIPQYAAIVIRSTNRGDVNGSLKGTKDFFTFDYKYTYKP